MPRSLPIPVRFPSACAGGWERTCFAEEADSLAGVDTSAEVDSFALAVVESWIAAAGLVGVHTSVALEPKQDEGLEPDFSVAGIAGMAACPGALCPGSLSVVLRSSLGRRDLGLEIGLGRVALTG